MSGGTNPLINVEEMERGGGGRLEKIVITPSSRDNHPKTSGQAQQTQQHQQQQLSIKSIRGMSKSPAPGGGFQVPCIDIRLDSPEMSSESRTTEEEIRYYGSTSETSPVKRIGTGTGGGSTKDHHFNADVQVITSSEDQNGSTSNPNHPLGSNPNQSSSSPNNLKCPTELYTKDVDSVCTGYSDINRLDRFDPNKSCWWKHPKVKENWRVFFAAFGLLIIGTGLIAVGIVVTVMPEIDFQSYVFYIAGIICFIPGVYHVVYVYCAVKGKKGYDFYQLPLFN